jgi:K+ transporter
MIGTLGVVFGDIGTSPLYAFKQSIEAAGGISTETVLAILSLMIWSLLVVITFKYVLVIMRANNKGEGGTLALTALAVNCVESNSARWLVLSVGLIGASLFYGDCVITPAISVLSAIEGIEIATPVLAPYVVPITVVLIAALFAIERHGTATIGLNQDRVQQGVPGNRRVWMETQGPLGLAQRRHHCQRICGVANQNTIHRDGRTLVDLRHSNPGHVRILQEVEDRGRRHVLRDRGQERHCLHNTH